MSARRSPDMNELLQRLLDDQIEPEEMKRLQAAMLKDPRLQDYYLDSMFVCTVIRRHRPGAGHPLKGQGHVPIC
jgi:hypothetical protein